MPRCVPHELQLGDRGLVRAFCICVSILYICVLIGKQAKSTQVPLSWVKFFRCDMGTDSAGCWMGNWCQDKGMGGCPPPMGGRLDITSISNSGNFPGSE